MAAAPGVGLWRAPLRSLFQEDLYFRWGAVLKHEEEFGYPLGQICGISWGLLRKSVCLPSYITL